MNAMGNLGPYQEITTEAKMAGGVDSLLKSIKDAAVNDAAPRHRAQGSIGTIVAGVVVYAGYRYFVSYSEKKVALQAASLEAETKLRAEIDGSQDTGELNTGEPPSGPG